MNAIEARGLARRYGNLVAVDRVSFTVAAGEVFGLLGPNGAGKSTTVRMLTGYVVPSEGTALLDGYDMATQPLRARRRLGVVPEDANIYVDLTVWQNVMLMAAHERPRCRERPVDPRDRPRAEPGTSHDRGDTEMRTAT